MVDGKWVLAGISLAAALLGGGAALAAEHEVRMLDRGGAGMMVFEPPLLRMDPGDTVRFQVGQPGHNVESFAAMAPEGAAPARGRINEEIAVTFERPGVYGYQCKPHYSMGMIGLVVVGDGEAAKANLGRARATAHPPRARDRFQRLFQALGD